MLAALRAAFAFLTILIPGRIFSNTCMKNSTFFYPLVGIVLGFLLYYVAYFVFQLTHAPGLMASAYLIFSFFLTRGLHHDGLADVADAWGSGFRGAKFREVLKDSRIGSFGTIVLVLYFFLAYTALAHIAEVELSTRTEDIQLSLFSFQWIINQENIMLLILLAPIWGRIGLIVQPAFDIPYIPPIRQDDLSILGKDKENSPPSSLSQNMVHTFQRTRCFLWLSIFIAMALFLISPQRLIFILVTSFVIFSGYYLLSKREHGYNGDFLGAQCLCFECVVFLSSYI